MLNEAVNHFPLSTETPRAQPRAAASEWTQSVSRKATPLSKQWGQVKEDTSAHLHIVMHFNNLINIKVVRDTQRKETKKFRIINC